jgi:hypothetical protein
MKRPQRRKKPEGAVEISTLLEGALKTLGVKGDYDRAQLDSRCRFILGEKLSQALVRTEQKGTALKMEFNHPIYLQEMNFRKSEFLIRLKTELPEAGVKSLIFSLARTPRT